MLKEVVVLVVVIGCVSARTMLDKKRSDIDTYSDWRQKRVAAVDILRDLENQDESIFDDKREDDLNHALAFYDYIDAMQKRGCVDKFGICPKLARTCDPAFAAKNRRLRRKHRFAINFCRKTCHRCW